MRPLSSTRQLPLAMAHNHRDQAKLSNNIVFLLFMDVIHYDGIDDEEI